MPRRGHRRYTYEFLQPLFHRVQTAIDALKEALKGEDIEAIKTKKEELEKKAYILGKGKIPVQKYVDYKNNTVSSSFGK